MAIPFNFFASKFYFGFINEKNDVTSFFENRQSIFNHDWTLTSVLNGRDPLPGVAKDLIIKLNLGGGLLSLPRGHRCLGKQYTSTVFIDGGCFTGDSISAFLDNKYIDTRNSFLCRPENPLTCVGYDGVDYSDSWQKIKENPLYKEIQIEFYQALISTQNQQVPFTQRPYDLSNSILTSPKSAPWILTVDIASLIEKYKNSPDCYLILKLDVEGAEYDILNKLLQDNLLTQVNELYIEFHDFLYPQYKTITENLRQLLIKNQDLIFIEWFP